MPRDAVSRTANVEITALHTQKPILTQAELNMDKKSATVSLHWEQPIIRLCTKQKEKCQWNLTFHSTWQETRTNPICAGNHVKVASRNLKLKLWPLDEQYFNKVREHSYQANANSSYERAQRVRLFSINKFAIMVIENCKKIPLDSEYKKILLLEYLRNICNW